MERGGWKSGEGGGLNERTVAHCSAARSKERRSFLAPFTIKT